MIDLLEKNTSKWIFALLVATLPISMPIMFLIDYINNTKNECKINYTFADIMVAWVAYLSSVGIWLMSVVIIAAFFFLIVTYWQIFLYILGIIGIFFVIPYLIYLIVKK